MPACVGVIIGLVATLNCSAPKPSGAEAAAMISAVIPQWQPVAPERAPRDGVVVDSTIRLSVHPGRSLDESFRDWNAWRLFDAYASGGHHGQASPMAGVLGSARLSGSFRTPVGGSHGGK